MQKFETASSLKNFLTVSHVEEIAVQSLDLTEIETLMLNIAFSKCLFLGCTMSDDLLHHLLPENFIFPALDVPFNTYPNRLYDKNSLYNGFNRHEPETYFKTLDKIGYDYYKKSHEDLSIKDTLAQRLHDHSITDSLQEYISGFDERKLTAIIGGHKIKRTDNMYFQVASLSKLLTENGYLMLSGGGPGAMEATHVGAWMARRTDDELRQAIDILSAAPLYSDDKWLSSAFEVMERFPDPQFDSLGIPTWYYGHELPTPFATKIAKYFENSVREEGLLAIAKGGVIFTPGSAGTFQEVFQDLAQNHYESYGYASPMIFLNKNFWTNERPIFPIIEQMSERGDLMNLNLGLYDNNEDVVAHLKRFSE
ncbi:LOG family protein [Petrimonas sp.]|uniref:LOG family protein n=1 Tax=Petrimonas sp. TaxID=2023866 RepID=UPI003F50DC3C